MASQESDAGPSAGRSWRSAVGQLGLAVVSLGAVAGVVAVAWSQPHLEPGDRASMQPAESSGGCLPGGEPQEAWSARIAGENRELAAGAVDVLLVSSAEDAALIAAAIEREAFLRAATGEVPRQRSVAVAGEGAVDAWYREAARSEGSSLRVIDLRGAVLVAGRP